MKMFKEGTTLSEPKPELCSLSPEEFEAAIERIQLKYRRENKKKETSEAEIRQGWLAR